MQIQECFEGQRVRFRETGKSATIKEVHPDKNEVLIEFDNHMTSKVHPRSCEPLTEADATTPVATTGPTRACPQCAAKMPAEVTTCPKCGFAYGVKPAKSSSGLTVLIIALVIAAVAALVVWKFVVAR